jgi:type VI secretion system secreted protein VgrG
MPERLTQSDRFARLTTPLGDDVLVLVKLDGTEGISENFVWRISCLLNYEEDPVDPAKIIGKACHVEMETPAGTKRYFHGLCTELRFRGWRGDHMYYELVLRPWSWLLTREMRCQIFHDLSVNEILNQIFSDRGFSDVNIKLQKSYDPIAYCVQYQETTFSFISRLMERYGLFFYFEGSQDKHKMIVVDDQNSLPDVNGYGSLRFRPYTEIGVRGDRLFDWQSESRLRTAVVDVDDYNYEKPNTALEKSGSAKDIPKHAYNQQKQYRYPAGHLEPGVGQLLADVLVDVERADAARKFASGYAPLIFAGGVFKLADHPVEAENARHFAVTARHSLFVQHSRGTARPAPGRFATMETRESATEPENDHYEGEYEVADVTKAYKAPLRTPWPRIHGAQTALVIKEKNAPADEEIDVDDQGRILVRFHWNDKAEDGQCSCRVRVAQSWAGSQWGGVWIPRVGMEAVVEFLDGDPDRPLVTGTVYNGNNKSPVNLPADKTKSTIKSNSSKGGGGANELTFDDKKNNELVTFIAEKNYEQTIKNNATIKIGYDKADAGDMEFKLKNNLTETIEGKNDYTLTGNLTQTIKQGNHTLTLNQGNQSTTLKLGNQTIKMNAGKGEVEAMQSYEIKVGSSSIKIDQTGVTIKGMQVKIEGTMMLEAKGMMTTVKGDAMLTLKGGIIMIN